MSEIKSIVDWYNDDLEWNKQRKKQWRYVKASLEVTRWAKAKQFKILKTYFLTGKIDNEKEFDDSTGGNSFMIRIWFHPQDDNETYRAILNDYPQMIMSRLLTGFLKYESSMLKCLMVLWAVKRSRLHDF